MKSRWLIGCLGVLVAGSLARAQDQTFDSKGVKIRYLVQGKGEPVLLIHGFCANVPLQWGLPGIVRELSKSYQVIALDNRGHGQSGKPHDSIQYGREMVEDSIRLLDHLKIKKAHFIGYSMGAMITAKLMTLYPDRVLSAVLGGAGGLRDGEDVSFFDVLAKSLEEGKGIGPLLIALNPANRPLPTEEHIKAVNAMVSLGNDPKALAAVVRSWKDLTIKDDALMGNKVPVMALIGSLDPLKRSVDGMKGKLTGLEVVVIPDSDHMDAFRKPEFIKSIESFLSKNSAESGR